MHPGHETQKVLARRIIGWREPLGQEGEWCACLGPLVRNSKYLDRARIDLGQIEQRLDESGLASAVDANQSEELALAHGEAHAAEHSLTPVALGNTVEAYRDIHRNSKHAKFRHTG